MRTLFLAAVTIAPLLLLGGPAPARAGGGSALRVQVDRTKVDLKEHRLEVKMSLPAGKVKIRVISDADATLADEEQDFTGRPAGTPLVVTWSPSSEAPVGKIELRVYDARGSWVGVELSPWLVTIQHDDVNFQTGSADIDDKEAPKLEAAFGKLNEVLEKDRAHGRQHPGLTLYIAGHTDTVGSDGSNLKLSQGRARSIGGWFRKRGVRLPIAFEGFGETSPTVRTPDNTDEVRNRRADYILSDGPPGFKTSGFKPSWKRIP